MAVAIPFIALAVSAAGTYMAYQAQQDQAKSAEKMGEYNAKVAENNATAAADAARFEANQIERRTRLILGRQKAMVAKAGVLDSGSMLDVFMDSAVQGELDRMAALYAGDVRTRNYISQGILAKAEGSSASSAYRSRSYATLLSGAGNVAGTGYSMSQED